MSVKSIMLTIGFLSMMGATVALSSSNSVVSDAQSVDVIDSSPTGESQSDSIQIAGGEKVMRVDVIDSLPTGWQWDSMKPAGEKVVRVDVIDSVEWRGDVYAYTSGSMRVDVIDNIRS